MAGSPANGEAKAHRSSSPNISAPFEGMKQSLDRRRPADLMASLYVMDERGFGRQMQEMKTAMAEAGRDRSVADESTKSAKTISPRGLVPSPTGWRC
jgi:hypothetical protein